MRLQEPPQPLQLRSYSTTAEPSAPNRPPTGYTLAGLARGNLTPPSCGRFLAAAGQTRRGSGYEIGIMMLRHILPQCGASYLILATTHLGVASGCRDHHRGGARVSRGRHPAADPDLGQHAVGCLECGSRPALVAGAV